MPKGFAIIISAPSGTGKTTVCNSLREIVPGLKFTISHTTRKIREGEVFETRDQKCSKDEKCPKHENCPKHKNENANKIQPKD